jgi:hypothetical protein
VARYRHGQKQGAAGQDADASQTAEQQPEVGGVPQHSPSVLQAMQEQQQHILCLDHGLAIHEVLPWM